MIPKIIHYCWLSKDPYPDNIQKCIESWKNVLPDYDIWLWNFERFPRGTSQWVDQAFDNHKYAFAADYIRLYALFHYGGIYLDSDVEVLKSFDELLDLPYFIGKENTPSGIEAATIGAEAGNELIGIMLSRYENRSFIKEDGKFDTQPLPFIFRNCIDTQFEYYPISNKCDFVNNLNVINVFPVDWFSPKTWDTKELNITNNTFSIHHFAGSWLDKKAGDEKKQYEEFNCISENESHKQFSMKEIFYSAVKRMLLNRNVLFLSKTNFIEAFCGFYELQDSNPLHNVDIPNDLEKLIESLSSKKIIEYDFIRIDCSMSSKRQDHFYPIVKIKDIEVEMHLTNLYSKEEARAYFNEFNSLFSSRILIPYMKEPVQWNIFDIIWLCLKINFLN